MKLKPIAAAVAAACRTIGFDWREQRDLAAFIQSLKGKPQ